LGDKYDDHVWDDVEVSPKTANELHKVWKKQQNKKNKIIYNKYTN